tara:strand:- start:565 stop:684 length:120 start_codon:yes stop_codon:yes gene_type:complete
MLQISCAPNCDLTVIPSMPIDDVLNKGFVQISRVVRREP